MQVRAETLFWGSGEIGSLLILPININITIEVLVSKVHDRVVVGMRSLRCRPRALKNLFWSRKNYVLSILPVQVHLHHPFYY